MYAKTLDSPETGRQITVSCTGICVHRGGYTTEKQKTKKMSSLPNGKRKYTYTHAQKREENRFFYPYTVRTYHALRKRRNVCVRARVRGEESICQLENIHILNERQLRAYPIMVGKKKKKKRTEKEKEEEENTKTSVCVLATMSYVFLRRVCVYI